MVLEEFAGYVPSWVPGKLFLGGGLSEALCCKLHHLLLENLHLLRETGAGEAVLVGVGLGEAKPTAAKWACRNQEQNPLPLQSLYSAFLTKLNILPAGKEISILSALICFQ